MPMNPMIETIENEDGSSYSQILPRKKTHSSQALAHCRHPRSTSHSTASHSVRIGQARVRSLTAILTITVDPRVLTVS